MADLLDSGSDEEKKQHLATLKQQLSRQRLLINDLLVAGRIESKRVDAVSYTHLRAHETVLDHVCRLLLEKKKKQEKWRGERNSKHTGKFRRYTVYHQWISRRPRHVFTLSYPTKARTQMSTTHSTRVT